MERQIMRVPHPDEGTGGSRRQRLTGPVGSTGSNPVVAVSLFTRFFGERICVTCVTQLETNLIKDKEREREKEMCKGHKL